MQFFKISEKFRMGQNSSGMLKFSFDAFVEKIKTAVKEL